MPLPTNKTTSEISYHNFTMYDGSVIRIRSYRIADIESYLKRVGKRDNIRSNEKATYDLLKSCTHPEDQEILENLDRINIIYLLVLLRVHSVNGLVPYPHSCPECQTVNIEYKIPIMPNLKHSYDENKKIVFSDDLEINLRNIPFSKELELSLLEDDELRDRYELFYRIESFRFGDEVVARHQFTIEDFRDWLESDPGKFNLTNEQYLEFIDKLESFKDYIRIETEDSCIACGHRLTMVVDDFSFFITA